MRAWPLTPSALKLRPDGLQVPLLNPALPGAGRPGPSRGSLCGGSRAEQADGGARLRGHGLAAPQLGLGCPVPAWLRAPLTWFK